MASERFRTVYQGYAPIAVAQIYAVPSGYSAVVKPVRMTNVRTGSSTTVSLYQGSGVESRIALRTDIDAAGYAVDDSPITVSSGAPLFALQTLASGAVLHVSAVEYPTD